MPPRRRHRRPFSRPRPRRPASRDCSPPPRRRRRLLAQFGRQRNPPVARRPSPEFLSPRSRDSRHLPHSPLSGYSGSTMSYWTSLQFYRPTSPPQITGTTLGAFVRAFVSLEVSDASADMDTTIKFGAAVDQDERPCTWEEEVSPGSVVSIARTINWDVTVGRGPLVDIAGRLDQLDRMVYRAHIPLGSLVPDISERFVRAPSREEPDGLSLFTCSLKIEPVLLANMASASTFFGGWVSLSFGGYGQIWPWTTKDLVSKAENSLTLRRLMDLCRHTWPVPSSQPTGRVQASREQMGDLWPYVDRERPLDWSWSVCEG